MPLPLNPQRTRIIEMREAGLTFAAIASELGLTRNAVSGVCRRAGLCGAINPPERKPATNWRDRCSDCDRPIEADKRFCGPCEWARHMAGRRNAREAANA